MEQTLPFSKVGKPEPGQHYHNEFFQKATAQQECKCGANGPVFEWLERLDNDEIVVVKSFCQECFQEQVLEPIIDHVAPCGCTHVNLVAANDGQSLPEWLRMREDIKPMEHDPDSPYRDAACYNDPRADCYMYRVATRAEKQQLMEKWRTQRQKRAEIA
jgi:hypothetical protein